MNLKHITSAICLGATLVSTAGNWTLDSCVEELGRKACGLLLQILEGEEVEGRTLLGYEVRMRESTKRLRRSS